MVTGASLGAHAYKFTVSSGSLDLAVSAYVPIAATWNVADGGSWSTSVTGNWTPATTPSHAGDTAHFGAIIGTSTATVTIDGGNLSVGALTFNTTGGGSYIIAGPYMLTFDNDSAGSAQLSNNGGNHAIAAPVALASNLVVSATTGSSLTISGPISEASPGTSVTLTGGGELILTGTNTYTGGTTVSSGTLDFASPAATPSRDRRGRRRSRATRPSGPGAATPGYPKHRPPPFLFAG